MENNIYKILLSNDISSINNIVSNFSYEERLDFYKSVILNRNIELASKLKYVLKEEEIIKYINENIVTKNMGDFLSSDDKNLLVQLFNDLEINKKFEEALNLNEAVFNYFKNNIIHNDNLRNEFVNYIIENDLFNDYRNVVKSIIINYQDEDKKIKSIDKLIEHMDKEYLQNLLPNLNEEKIRNYFNNSISEILKANMILKSIDTEVSKAMFYRLKNDKNKLIAIERFSDEYISSFDSKLDFYSKQLNTRVSYDEKNKMFESVNKQKEALIIFNDREKLLILSNFNEEDKMYILSTIKEANSLFKGINFLEKFSNKLKLLTSYTGKYPNYSDEYKEFVEDLSFSYGINSDHLILLSKITTLEIIKHLNNKNIKSILNMNENDFQKFMSFFSHDNIKLNNHTLNNIFESFAQKKFLINFNYLRRNFNDTLKFIEKGDKEEIKNKLFEIFKNLDKDYKNDYTIDSLCDLLIIEDKKAINDLHNMCNYVLESTRRIEVKTSIDIYKSDYLETEYEVTSSIENILKNRSFEFIYNNYLLDMLNNTDSLLDDEKELIKNKELLNKIYMFKKNPNDEVTLTIKKKIYAFNKLMDKFYSLYKNDDEIKSILRRSNSKKTYALPDVDYEYLIGILSNIDANKLQENLNNKEVYESLKKVFNEYKFLAFNSKFEGLELDADTYCDDETVASIFLNYDRIIETLNEKSQELNMTSILDVADTYSPKSKKYRDIFGEEDFLLINLNPPDKRASTTRKERREESLKNYINCYKRDYVTVPSFDEDIDLGKKKINVVVGNFTNPINLTLGERTSSCMRSGGEGDDLYNFCLNDENGFHIRLTNPQTGTFVARVSGFRNGNTVFLNELRVSFKNNCSSSELISACQIAADMLISKSKGSEYPIDNVVISDQYVMENSTYEKQNLNISTIFTKMSTTFWMDISKSEAIVLSTSNKDKSLVPIKFGNKDVDKYEVQRDKVVMSKNPTESVRHIETLEQLLLGRKLDDINLPDIEYKVCYYGEDWYVAIDEAGIVHKKIISKSKNFEKAFEEMKVVLEDMNLLEKTNKEKNKLSNR